MDAFPDSADVFITVFNRPPNAADDVETTTEGEDVSFNVLSNDGDPDGDALSLAGNTDPAHGTLGGGSGCEIPGGDCQYRPDPGYVGPDSFQYTVSDGTDTDTGTVAITVQPANRPPVATDDADTTAQATPIQVNVLENDRDPDGDVLTVTRKTNPAHGTADCSSGTSCLYAPNPSFSGSDQFSYTAHDGKGGDDDAIVRIEVIAANRPPVATDDAAVTEHDQAKMIAVLANDSDPDGDPLSVVSAGPASNGTVTVNPDDTVTYTPNPGFSGSDAFDYTISDGRGGTDTGRVSMTVTPGPPPNRPPNAVNDGATTSRDRAVTINVLANDSDPDGDALTVTGVADPPHGHTVVNPDRTVTYTPDAGFTGGDAFTYAISDGHGGTDTGTVSVTVIAPGNQAPETTIDTPSGDVTVAPGQAVSFSGTASDADGTIVAFTWTFDGGTPASSAVEDPGSVTFTTPGTYVVQFDVVDNNGASDPTPARRTITVREGGGGDLVPDVDRTSPGSAGRVDGHDVLFVLRAVATQDLAADVNADGHVDQADVDRVVAALGERP